MDFSFSINSFFNSFLIICAKLFQSTASSFFQDAKSYLSILRKFDLSGTQEFSRHILIIFFLILLD
jgi:hypothetical protein